MSYFGFIYSGIGGSYSLNEAKKFDSPYQALRYAESLWNDDPNIEDSSMLLTVIKKDTDDSASKQAFFQFTSTDACNIFIQQQEKFDWSPSGYQAWNGDANYMRELMPLR